MSKIVLFSSYIQSREAYRIKEDLTTVLQIGARRLKCEENSARLREKRRQIGVGKEIGERLNLRVDALGDARVGAVAVEHRHFVDKRKLCVAGSHFLPHSRVVFVGDLFAHFGAGEKRQQRNLAAVRRAALVVAQILFNRFATRKASTSTQ